MADKKFTTEELAKQVEEAKKQLESLNAQLQKQKKEEEDQRQAELALKKDARKKEVDDAWANYNSLLKAYIEDYGVYSNTTDEDDFVAMSRMLPWWF